MTDDTVSPTPPTSDLEARLRAVMVEKGEGAPVGAADWGDLAGRLASTTRRRSRVFVGAAVMALLVGAAGGYFGEAAASPNQAASPHAPSGSKAKNNTAVSGTARAPARSGVGPSSAMMCPDQSATSPGTDVGSASRLFVRTTADGVVVRVYRFAPSRYSCSGPPTPVTVPGVAAPGAPAGSPGSAGSGGSTGSTAIAPIIAPLSQVTVELSDDNAVGQGVLSGSVCLGPPLMQGGVGAAGAAPSDTTATTVAPASTTTTTTPAPPTGLRDITTGTFGVLEGDPVWWVAVEVGSDVTSVRMTFPDGSTDQMAPVGGIAVVAARVTPAVASSSPGPYTVRGTLALLGAGGTALDTITLPQESPPVPVPMPVPVPVPVPVPGPKPLPAPLNQAGASSSSAMIVCPQATTTTPKTQSSPTTVKR